jgi:hypothetical protein
MEQVPSVLPPSIDQNLHVHIDRCVLQVLHCSRYVLSFVVKRE